MRVVILIICTLCVMVSCTVNGDSNNDLRIFDFGLGVVVKEYLKKGLKKVMDVLSKTILKTDFTCIICEGIVLAYEVIMYYSDSKSSSKDWMKNIVLETCILKYDSTVCNGLIDLNFDIITYILDNDNNNNNFCGMFAQFAGCTEKHPVMWNISVDKGTKQLGKPNSGKTPIKVLHITDLHYDPYYKPGSRTECNRPVCCQSDDLETPEEPNKAAGYWGNYGGCNVPWHTFKDTLRHIKETHRDIKYVYFTGDIIAHRVWDTSVKNNTDQIRKVMKELKSEFGSIKVLPILGNHETHPVNLYATNDVVHPNSEYSTNWLYDQTAELYSMWWNDTEKTLRRGGFYTVLIEKGLRVIGINSNVCYTFNWWLVLDNKDPYGQLQWLSDTLKKAESDNEQVQILSHIPSGDDTCLISWSKEFNKIVNRYSNIITGIFSGHTHYDELRLYFDKHNKPSIVGYVGGSLTPYEEMNPNYRIYTMDPVSFEVLDYDEWYFNVTEANLTPEKSPTWKHLYSFKKTYNVPDMTPESIHEMVLQMPRNKTLLNTYNRFKGRLGDLHIAKRCNYECHRKNLCDIMQTLYSFKNEPYCQPDFGNFGFSFNF